MKNTALWETALCSLVEVDRRFRGAYCLHYRLYDGEMMEAICTSETSANFKKTTLRYRSIPERHNLHTRRRENLKSHVIIFLSSSFFERIGYSAF
jgi:hypothetical protein